MGNNYIKQTLKDMAMEDRPREKLIENGVKYMTCTELLAILLGSGTRDTNAISLAQQILNKYDNDIYKLIKVEIYDLLQFKGIGLAKAVTIVAAIELGLRCIESKKKECKNIRNSEDIYQIFKPLIAYCKYEEFWTLYLNRNLNILAKDKISHGSVNATSVDPRKIIRLGINVLASSIVLCHNHPSGNPNPSNEDIKLTEKMFKAAKLFDIQVLDHIIVTDNSFYSFADNGIMPN